MTFRNKPLVFIVEDNPTYRMLIRRVLQKQGYMVMLFEHGRKATEMLNYIRPALIVSDIEMPCMDGFEFHEYVQKHFEDYKIPFIYLSSTNSKKMKKKAAELSSSPMLDKPVSAEELKNAIKRVLPDSQGLSLNFQN